MKHHSRRVHGGQLEINNSRVKDRAGQLCEEFYNRNRILQMSEPQCIVSALCIRVLPIADDDSSGTFASNDKLSAIYIYI